MPQSTVSTYTYEDEQGTEHTQYKTSVPKSLAEAMDMGGKKLDWSVESKNTLQVRIINDE
jgi:hypothetical protein